MKYFYKDTSPPTKNYHALHQAIDEGLVASRAYHEHLRNIASRLPEETRSFALQAWYGDPRSHDCPHDGWFIKLIIQPSSNEDRLLNASIRVLGAYHDRILEYEYSNVIECRVNMSGISIGNVGDWLADEFDVLDSGFVSHEIQWQHGTPWRIIATRVRLIISDYPIENR